MEQRLNYADDTTEHLCGISNSRSAYRSPTEHFPEQIGIPSQGHVHFLWCHLCSPLLGGRQNEHDNDPKKEEAIVENIVDGDNRDSDYFYSSMRDFYKPVNYTSEFVYDIYGNLWQAPYTWHQDNFYNGRRTINFPTGMAANYLPPGSAACVNPSLPISKDELYTRQIGPEQNKNAAPSSVGSSTDVEPEQENKNAAHSSAGPSAGVESGQENKNPAHSSAGPSTDVESGQENKNPAHSSAGPSTDVESGQENKNPAHSSAGPSTGVESGQENKNAENPWVYPSYVESGQENKNAENPWVYPSYVEFQLTVNASSYGCNGQDINWRTNRLRYSQNGNRASSWGGSFNRGFQNGNRGSSRGYRGIQNGNNRGSSRGYNNNNNNRGSLNGNSRKSSKGYNNHQSDNGSDSSTSHDQSVKPGFDNSKQQQRERESCTLTSSLKYCGSAHYPEEESDGGIRFRENGENSSACSEMSKENSGYAAAVKKSLT